MSVVPLDICEFLIKVISCLCAMYFFFFQVTAFQKLTMDFMFKNWFSLK